MDVAEVVGQRDYVNVVTQRLRQKDIYKRHLAEYDFPIGHLYTVKEEFLPAAPDLVICKTDKENASIDKYI